MSEAMGTRVSVREMVDRESTDRESTAREISSQGTNMQTRALHR